MKDNKKGRAGNGPPLVFEARCQRTISTRATALSLPAFALTK